MSWADTPTHGHTATTASTLGTLGKNQRSYSLEGLASREVLIFKSMVRLLSHRTQHVWTYLPHSTELRVVAEGLAVAVDAPKYAQHVLTLGTANVKRHLYLQTPLHANELEAALNQVGAMISFTNPAVRALAAAPLGMTPMRMLRWPPASVLTTTTRVRLATVMSSKPFTLAELQQRSGQNLAVCASFFDELRQLDLLVSVVHSPPPAMLTTSSEQPSNGPRAKPISVQPSLLERIRLRLGLRIFNTSGQSSR